MKSQKNREILIGSACGFCSGVKRAIRMAYSAVKDKKQIYTFGPIIHNPQVVKKLAENNIINENDINLIAPASTVLIRTHGIPLKIESKLRRCFNIVDATCPIVKRVHKICESMAEEFDIVFIIGSKQHPEIKSILSRTRNKGIVITTLKEADMIKPFKKAGLLVQTTFSQKEFFKIAGTILKKGEVIKIHNTVCRETINRQNELIEIAKAVDILFIVGGKNSSNTKKLYETGKDLTETYHIEVPEDIDFQRLKNKNRIGIITGASTPIEMVKKIECKLRQTDICAHR